MISATSGWALLSTANPNISAALQLGRTTDGGRTWHLVSSPAPSAASAGGVELLDAVSAERAWIVAATPSSAGGKTELFLTDDGGRSWRRCDKVGIAFISQRTGWIATWCNAGYSILVSRDGGAHWSSQQLPIPQSACEQAGCAVSAPQFAGNATFLAVGDYPDTALLFVSADAGASWRTVIMPRGAGPYPRVRFFSQSDGIAVSAGSQGAVGKTFYLTSDGGLSWTAVPQGRHFGRSGASFDFVSPSTGFAWLLPGISPQSAAPKMYRTSNSGRAWISSVPRLA